MNTLADYAKGEELNSQVSLNRLGDAAPLVDELEVVWEKLSSLLSQAALIRTMELIGAVGFIRVSVRDEGIRIALSTLRGHAAPSLRMLRRSVELTGQAWLLHRAPTLADVWWRRHQSDENEKKAKDTFKVTTLFPKNDPVIWPLYQRYEYFSTLVHPSLASVSGRARTKQVDEEHLDLAMDFFGIRTEDENQPMLTWLMGVDTNLRLLGVFLKIYAEELGTNAAVMDLNFNAFETRLNFIEDEVHAEALRGVARKGTSLVNVTIYYRPFAASRLAR